MISVIDNDIVLKVVCYGLIDELLLPVCKSMNASGILGTARFVIWRRLRKISLNGGPTEAVTRLEGLLRTVSIIEPTDEELQVAADLELSAQRTGVNLDTGESQLCAVAIKRCVAWLLTGDKRAIAGLEVLLDHDQRVQGISGKVLCLEQLVLAAVDRDMVDTVRDAICAQSIVDKTLAICFSCQSCPPVQSIREGLQSYINALRGSAPRMLAI